MSHSLKNSGFALVVVMFVVLLVAALGLYLCVQTSNQWSEAGETQSQLYSLVLAENGVEFARTLLPQVEINTLLKGPDGTHGGTASAEWRNPIPFLEARRLTPESWTLDSDDGWPAYDGELLLPTGHEAPGAGRFYIRFSNNPTEKPDEDQDGVVIVRSLGLTRSRAGGLFQTARRNDVSLVEAVLRQERVFDLPAALVLFGERAQFDWQNPDFLFDGGSNPGALVISGDTKSHKSRLEGDLLDSLSPALRQKLVGAGLTPSLLDATSMYLKSPIYRAVFSAQFWRHFREHVSDFTDSEQPGLFYYPAGGTISGEFQGLLIAAGDFQLTAADFKGVLVHLGGGRLTLGEGTTLHGAIWMSNADGDKQLRHEDLQLTVVGPVSVVRDPDEIRAAVGLLPPTQLGWRILFPEMRL
jgi:hypothetical protein